MVREGSTKDSRLGNGNVRSDKKKIKDGSRRLRVTSGNSDLNTSFIRHSAANHHH